MPDPYARIASTVEAILKGLSFVSLPGAEAAAQAVKGVEKMRSSQAVKQRLENLLYMAEEDFSRVAMQQGCGDAAEWVLQMPQSNRESFGQALQAVLNSADESQLASLLSAEFTRLPGGQPDQAAAAARLYLTCLWRRLMADADFRPILTGLAALRTEQGVAQVKGLVEQVLSAITRLETLHWPVQPPPAVDVPRPSLLHPKYRLLPYSGETYQQARQTLLDWALGLKANGLYGLRVVTGPGGQGKTRLLIEVGEALRAQGWQSGFLSVGHPREEGLPSLLASPGPLLLILDYIETRQQDCQSLLRAAASAWRGPERKDPLAVVLIERETPGWLNDLLNSTGAGEYNDWPEFLALPGVSGPALRLEGLEAADRACLFENALAAFRRLRGWPQGPSAEVSMESLPPSPLAVALTAFHAAQGQRVPVSGGEDAVYRFTWQREREFWQRRLRVTGGTAMDAELISGICERLEAAACAASLGWPFAGADDLKDFFAAHFPPLLQAGGPLDADWLACGCARLFPSRRLDEGLAIVPDPLADYVLAKFLEKDATWIARLLPPAGRMANAAEESAARVWRLVEVLLRVGERGGAGGISPLTEAWMRAAADGLEARGQELPEGPGGLDFFRILESRLPDQSVPLRRLALALARALLAHTPDEDAGARAGLLNNLANCLSEVGEREEALKAAREAVDIRRVLAQAQPAAFLPNLAASLNNLSVFYSEVGEREEALKAAREAAETYRRLAQAQPAAFLPNLAMSLNNLAGRLSEVGEREEALKAAREAVDIRRVLAQAQPAAFLPDLAASLNNLANRLSEVGEREEALKAAREAVEILSPFFIKLPAGYANWMNNIVQTYRKACEDIQQEADQDLLAPVLRVFEDLKKQAGEAPAPGEPPV